MIAAPGSAAQALPSTTKRFRLSGTTVELDRRVHAIRRDIADIALAGQLFAPHYAHPEFRFCGRASVMVHAAAEKGAAAVTQLLRGERFAVLEISGNWAWGYCLHDHYVGYVPFDALVEACPPPTHVVSTRTALVFAEADIKSRVVAHWPMGARCAVIETDDRFIRFDAGYLHRRHAHDLDRLEPDFVGVAERLIGTPYLWGGRAGDGLDCSGLVQLSLGMAGIDAPRDSDQQRALGREIPAGEALRRGDLIFFPGHVGIMVDAERMIHANAFWMAVAVEPLAHVVARLTRDHETPITARRRIDR